MVQFIHLPISWQKTPTFIIFGFNKKKKIRTTSICFSLAPISCLITLLKTLHICIVDSKIKYVTSAAQLETIKGFVSKGSGEQQLLPTHLKLNRMFMITVTETSLIVLFFFLYIKIKYTETKKTQKNKNKRNTNRSIQRIKKIHLKGKKIYPSFNMIEATMTDKTVNARFFTRFFKVQIAVSLFFKQFYVWYICLIGQGNKS